MKSIKSLATWYFSKAALPYWSILILDCLFVVFAGVLAYTVHHGSEHTLAVMGSLSVTLCVPDMFHHRVPGVPHLRRGDEVFIFL